MLDNPIARRSITVPAAIVSFVVLTVLSPFAFALASLVDVSRALVASRPWVATRGVLFLWVYLLGEMWALLAILFTVPLPLEPKQRITFELQGAWARWNLAALQRIFSVRIVVEGVDAARRGPILLLSRHASLVDTLLPAHLVANPFHIRLRYVLKRELLIDPALDIAGNRLPNHFVDRSGSESGDELSAIRELATDLTPDEGVLIFPEGTRFSERKRQTYVRRLVSSNGDFAEIAAGYEAVLPPRPGGTLALLDASEADVVVLAHHGLEGLATLREIWNGRLVGQTISARLWRIPRAAIPTDRSQRVEWLFRVWAKVDQWVVAREEEAS